MKHTALVRQLPQERILDKKHLRKKWDQTDRFFRGNAEEGEKERERRHVPVKGIPSEGEMPTNKPASPIAQLVRALH